MAPDHAARVKKWESSGNFARDVMIALLWGTLDWYQELTLVFVRCQDATEQDIDNHMGGTSARLNIAYEDLGKMIFERLERHHNSDGSFEVRSKTLDRQRATLAEKRKQIEKELDDIRALQAQIQAEKAKMMGAADDT